jgi:hypothetical protein
MYKNTSITLHFFELSSLDKPIEQRKPLVLSFRYFDTLKEALEKFNNIHNKNVTELFNQFGQKIPLTYHVQKTGLTLYY